MLLLFLHPLKLTTPALALSISNTATSLDCMADYGKVHTWEMLIALSSAIARFLPIQLFAPILSEVSKSTSLLIPRYPVTSAAQLGETLLFSWTTSRTKRLWVSNSILNDFPQSNQNTPLSLVEVEGTPPGGVLKLVYIPNPSQTVSQRLNQVSPKLAHIYIYQSMQKQHRIQNICNTICSLLFGNSQKLSSSFRRFSARV